MDPSRMPVVLFHTGDRSCVCSFPSCTLKGGSGSLIFPQRDSTGDGWIVGMASSRIESRLGRSVRFGSLPLSPLRLKPHSGEPPRNPIDSLVVYPSRPDELRSLLWLQQPQVSHNVSRCRELASINHLHTSKRR